MTTYMAGKIDISLIFQALWQNERWNIRQKIDFRQNEAGIAKPDQVTQY